MNELVAVVDDEPDIVELVTIHLERANYRVTGFNDGTAFLDFIRKTLPDLVVLDLMLPDIDGLEICKQIKSDNRTKSIPVIMLTAKAEVTERVIGLELGADDYMAKPFSPREVVARVRAVLRRQETRAAERKIALGSLALDLDRHEARQGGAVIDLTATEFKIIELLSSQPGRVFSRDQILDHLWGREKIVVDRTVDVHIRNLREKLGIDGKMIRNIRGVGYKIET